MLYRFVATEPDDTLLARMVDGGLNATEADGYDEVFVSLLSDKEWADEDAWIRAVEDRYVCVFDETVK